MPLAAQYDITGNELLSDAYNKLASAGLKTATQIEAELLLGLQLPVYTGSDADTLVYAIVIQINFQLLQGLTPDMHRSVSNTHPGQTTAYRDRFVDPRASAIVARVTKRATVGFTITGPGV